MATLSIDTPPSMLNSIPDWTQEPSHKILLSTPTHTLFIAAVPPNSSVLPHTHFHPALFITFLPLTYKNYILSSAASTPPKPQTVSVQKGQFISYQCTPSNPYAHTYNTTDLPAAFFGLEISHSVRLQHPPSPPQSLIPPPPHTTHHLSSLPFASAVTFTLPPSTSTTITSTPIQSDSLLTRLILRLSGPALQYVTLHENIVPIQTVQHTQLDISFEAHSLGPFPPTTQHPPPSTTLTNTALDDIQLVVVDVFAKHNSPTDHNA